MRYPKCSYENEEEALRCNLCGKAFRKEIKQIKNEEKSIIFYFTQLRAIRGEDLL